MIRKCKYCGKAFDATGTTAYCPGPHYATCEVCGKQFVYDVKNPKRCCSQRCSALLRKLTIASTVKICELCGKEFHSNSSTTKYCHGPHYRPCPVCGKSVLVEPGKEYEPASCCSDECTKEKRRRTSRKIYGTDVPSQSVEVKDKLRTAELDSRDHRISTVKERYGVDNVSQNKDIRKKISDTVSSDEWQSKFRASNRSKFGVDYPMQNEELKARLSANVESEYGVPRYCRTDECRAAFGNTISNINKRFADRLSEIGYSVEFEFHLCEFSYDIKIDDRLILIELDPTYTHNAIGANKWGMKREPDYHLRKTEVAVNHNCQCIHIFDWDSQFKILQLLVPRIKIPARRCSVVKLSQADTNQFLLQYHIQGPVRNQHACYGLVCDNQLIEIMTFGQPRYRKSSQWELLRLCTCAGITVVGGSQKLFSHFLTEHNPQSVISYCDRSKFTGDVYTRLGFSLDSITEPNKVWSKEDRKITNNLLLQRGYDQLFGTHYGKGISNEQLMLENGWLPVYDCGQGVYIWRT